MPFEKFPEPKKQKFGYAETRKKKKENEEFEFEFRPDIHRLRDNRYQVLERAIEKSPEKNPEKLDIYDDLAIRIHDLYYKRLLNKNEAESLMKFLKEKSGGQDNVATAKLIDVLNEVDLYLKEKLLESFVK
jgi:hypothetical protein